MKGIINGYGAVRPTIILGLTGSRAYGTHTENSDTDYRGVFIPDDKYYFGLGEAKEYSYSSGGKSKNTAKDVDISLSPLINFAKRCASGSPIDLELLFLREEDYINLTFEGRELVDNRNLFLSKRIRHRFGGYANNLKKGMVKGPNVDERLGYNPKSFMHGVRLYEMAIEVLREGHMNVYRHNHDTLRALREGEYSLLEAERYLDNLDMCLDKYHDTSSLPDNVDVEEVSYLLTSITKEYMGFYDN